MVIDSRKADEMQSALDEVFVSLPRHFQTEAIRLEMAGAVVRAEAGDMRGYRKAARAAVLAMFDSPEKAVRNRYKLAPFAGTAPA